MMKAWDLGWKVFFDALDALTEKDLDTIVLIRNEGQTVMDALQRQLAHYASHIGQIVYIAKMIKGDAFQTLSIPKGGSSTYNQKKFSAETITGHFTDKV